MTKLSPASQKSRRPVARSSASRFVGLKSAIREHSLKSLVSKASAARVLNLHGVAMGSIEAADDEDQPMFVHPVLNRCIVMKYNLPVGAEDKLAPRRFNSTKVVFPFDQDDLNLGGQALFIDEANFAGVLSSILDYTDLPIDRDLGVLRALDRLPTLDPFLVREILSQQNIHLGQRYCLLSEADKADMMAFVCREIEALVRLCFRDMESTDGRTRQLAELLLAEQNSAGLEPLRDIFRLNSAEFADAMFCWKAFLY